jgi:hypothetical protein
MFPLLCFVLLTVERKKVFKARIEKYSFSKYHIGALGSEDKISRCKHTVHTRIVSTCS